MRCSISFTDRANAFPGLSTVRLSVTATDSRSRSSSLPVSQSPCLSVYLSVEAGTGPAVVGIAGMEQFLMAAAVAAAAAAA